jgi:predicted 3-demethylubiquinone-9 3-methyltransferase (glyoxalase superfamily)
MARAVTPFLMFDGDAERAMELYVSLFDDAEILQIERYGPDGTDKEGLVLRAEFTLQGQRFVCIDSPVKHAFGFTPSISLFVDCADDAELERLFERLSAGGEVLMPVDEYGFSARFGWVNDRFGVSWQLNLP